MTVRPRQLLKRLSMAGAALVLTATSAWAAPILAVQPSVALTTVGGAVSLDVVISDVLDLASVGFDLDFDSSILSVDPLLPASEGTFLSSTGSTSFFALYDPSFDVDTIFFGLALDAISPGASTVGPAVIATFYFTGIAPGISPITLQNALLLDVVNAQLLAEGQDFQYLETGTQGGEVEVVASTAVPEPASLTLVALGVAALGWRRRRGLRV